MTVKNLLLSLLFIGILFNSCKKTIPQSKTLPIGLEETLTIITTIAADDNMGRNTGTPGYDSAADFATTYFSKNNLKPLFDSFKDSFIVDENIETYNLVAINQDIGVAESGKDLIFNGANDNASGVTASMQIGGYLASNDAIDKNIIVALFSAEERGLLGSKHLAKKMKEQGLSVDLVFNFEMIGTELTKKPNTVYLTGFELSDMAEKINTEANRELVVFFAGAKDLNLFRRSDNLAFYEEFDIPAQTFSSFDFSNYDYYHHVKDEVEELDIENMNAIINSLATAIESLLIKDNQIQLK